MRAATIALGVLSLTAFAGRPAPAPAQAVLLRVAPPVGQVTHYRTLNQSWVQFPDANADTTRPTVEQTTWTTRTVTGTDGDVRLVTTVVDSSASQMPGMGGMGPSGDMLRGMRLVQHIDARGRVLSTDITPPPGLPAAMAQRIADNASRSSTVMPERALRPGETWTDSMSMSPSQGGPPAEAHPFLMTYTLDRVETQGGSRVAVISLKGVMPGDSAGAPPAGTMSGELALDLGAGRLVRSTTELKVQIPTPNGNVPMRVASRMEALP